MVNVDIHMVLRSIDLVIYVIVRYFEGQKFTMDGTFIGKQESNTIREGEYRNGDPIIKEGVSRTIIDPMLQETGNS